MRRLSIKSAIALVDQELRPIRDTVIDISDDEITGIGRIPGSNNVVTWEIHY
ncbi:hypothetical protein [Vulcanisaeta sp. JCM 16159]|uniref:hypothetical protein n=1 Tax=Vulcanisaeta sp. JCM 16159 TaxID=1295371 RepID=UPI000A4D573D|nr:hypothetical protein [Vulcanisaeta sp. JCM 16159]